LASHDHSFELRNGEASTLTAASIGRNTTNITGNTANAGSGTGHNHSHTLSGTLTGNITTSLTGSVTAAGNNAFSPFVVVNYIIKH
jgi:hypothetical protein